MAKLQTAMSNYPPGGVGTALAWPDDEIPELGDRIASLTLAEAVQLSRYLDQEHGIRPELGPKICLPF